MFLSIIHVDKHVLFIWISLWLSHLPAREAMTKAKLYELIFAYLPNIRRYMALQTKFLC
jgi:hypothetical protein